MSDSGKDSRASRSHLLAEGAASASCWTSPARWLTRAAYWRACRQARRSTGCEHDSCACSRSGARTRAARLARDVSARFLAKARRERLDAGRRAFPPARVVAED